MTPLELSMYLDLFSTLFFAATIGLLIWGTRVSVKGLKQDAYIELRDNHQNLIGKMIEQPSLRKILDLKPNKVHEVSEKLTTDEICQIKVYFTLEFDLYERLYDEMKKNKKILYEEWLQWLIWLEKLSRNRLFKETFDEIKLKFWQDVMSNLEYNLMKEDHPCDGCGEKFITLSDLVMHVIDKENKICSNKLEKKFRHGEL